MGKKTKGIALEIDTGGEDLGLYIQRIALDQQEEMMRGLGIPQADITAARVECEKNFSDKPFKALMEKSPKYQALLKEFDPD